MKTVLSTATSIAVLGLLLVAGANVATAAQKQTAAAANPYECFTDDGYGRKRPCSAGYMQKRADSNGYDCFTDDGYGRKLPCSLLIKIKR